MGFAHAQATASNFKNPGTTTVTATLAGAPAAGDLVCVGVLWFDGTGTPPASITVADGNGNNYTKSANSPSGANAANNGFVYLFYLNNAPANASADVIATYSDTGAGGIAVILADDFTVSSGTSAFDLDVTGNGTGTTINTPTVTRSGSGELLYCCGAPAHAVTSVDSPWTQGAIRIGIATGYILSASVNTALAMTVNTTGTWDAMGASFSFTASGGGGTTKLKRIVGGRASLVGLGGLAS